MYEKFFLPTVPYLFKFTTQNLHSKQQVITQFPDRNPWERIHISAGRAEYISERHKHTKQEQIRPQNQKHPGVSGQRGEITPLDFILSEL